jgi:hypothetical protein
VIIGEALHIYHVLALVLVLIGITVAEWSGRRAAAAGIAGSA